MCLLLILFPRFGAVTSIFTYVLDNVDCTSSRYLVILQCGYSTSISSGCTHNFDEVSVTCCKYNVYKMSCHMSAICTEIFGYPF